MRSKALFVTGLVIGCAAALLVVAGTSTVQGQAQPGAGFAAIPGEKGGLDITGPYDVVPDWPKPMSASLPGHEMWTWGAVQGVFAESPDRVYMLQRGELPNIPRPQPKAFPEVGPSISFPTGQVPWRNASQGQVASPPGAGGPGADPDDPKQAWQGRMGIDARWEHTIVIFNSAGNIAESWTQWDKMMRRPHSVYINPWDAEKHVWIVDDHGEAVYEFTHDGKQIVLTLGTPNKPGDDSSHFNRPTFLAFLPDSSVFVSDGYNGHRVAKFDKSGKFLWTSGEAGMPGGRETRPGYFTTVHGIAADPVSKRVYVSDRSNRRIQVLDGDSGKVVDWWPVGAQTNLQFLIIPPDRSGVWGFTDTTSRIAKWDFGGHLLYSWGMLGDFPGAFLNMHGASTDQEGNLYIAEVGNGRLQKFRPRAGANKAFLVGPPLYAAWK
jgi:DNA-binding beta-propeller fold protein YncE